MKENDIIVEDELDDFYNDLHNSRTKLRLLLKWESGEYPNIEVPKMEFKAHKKKFQPKVKRPTIKSKHGRRGRISTF